MRLALDVRGERGSEAIVRAQRALHQVGLRHKLKSYPGQPERRRAAARGRGARPGRVRPPSCWPTSRPRPSTARTAWPSCSCCREIAKDKSRAVLAVTHDPRTVPFANRILRIEDGLIVGEERRAEGVETVHELARNRKRKANA